MLSDFLFSNNFHSPALGRSLKNIGVPDVRSSCVFCSEHRFPSFIGVLLVDGLPVESSEFSAKVGLAPVAGAGLDDAVLLGHVPLNSIEHRTGAQLELECELHDLLVVREVPLPTETLECAPDALAPGGHLALEHEHVIEAEPALHELVGVAPAQHDALFLVDVLEHFRETFCDVLELVRLRSSVQPIDVGQHLVVAQGLAPLLIQVGHETKLGVEALSIAEMNLVDEDIEIHEAESQGRPDVAQLLFARLHRACHSNDQVSPPVSFVVCGGLE